MLDQLPVEIQRKIFTSLPPNSLINVCSISYSVRQLKLSYLLMPHALECMFTLKEYNILEKKKLDMERSIMYQSCNKCFQRWAEKYNIPVWRVCIQDFIHTIDCIINRNDNKFNNIVSYYSIKSKSSRIPVFYTSRENKRHDKKRYLTTQTFYNAVKLGNSYFNNFPKNTDERNIQLSFYALVY